MNAADKIVYTGLCHKCEESYTGALIGSVRRWKRGVAVGIKCSACNRKRHILHKKAVARHVELWGEPPAQDTLKVVHTI